MYCSNCGTKLGDNYSFCPDCGQRVSDNVPHEPDTRTEGVSSIDRDVIYDRLDQLADRIDTIHTRVDEPTWTEFWLAVFLGWLGVHRFYSRKIASGVLYFFTFGLFFFGWFYDVVRILYRLVTGGRRYYR